MNAIRTLIVDDEPLAREGLRVLLGKDPEVEVVGECRDGLEAVRATRTARRLAPQRARPRTSSSRSRPVRLRLRRVPS